MCLLQCIQRMLSVLQPKGTTPLPWVTIAALFASMFGNAITIQMLFAFLPDMVKSFGIADEDSGYYVGLLASSLYFGRFASSYLWGWICDKIGRRKVLLWCLALMSVATMGFGFAKSFALAFVIRFFTGLTAGIAGTAKAALTEVCDETNQALGMSVVITAWNSGLIFGPALGGYLARPVDKYGVFKKGSLFDSYPYLFPCVINTVILVLAFILTFFKFPETLASLKKKKDEDSSPTLLVLDGKETPRVLDDDDSSVNRRYLSKSCPESVNNMGSANSIKTKDDTIDDMASPPPKGLLSSVSESFIPNVNLHDFTQTSLLKADSANSIVLPQETKKKGIYSRAVNSLRKSKLVTLLRNPNVRSSVGLYMAFSFAAISEHEMYSIWAASGKNLGGLAFDTNDLGFTLMLVGIGTVLSSCIVYPRLVKVLGHMKVQFLMIHVNIFFIIVFPATNILYSRSAALKATVVVILLILRIAQGSCYTGQFLFIGNSVPSNYRATVHGLAMTLSCGARSIAPTVAGSIFSWSVTSNLGFPFNEKCVFIFMGAVFWFALVIACCMDAETFEKRQD